ncbi:hypothetical protein TRVA0_004S04104 [Trichomonascus vanleenenianus]|uniref:uncharacterized protein n=1 Tax=Trichomonascus vanleenenianus TaxID=2268995 RepID=UPI003ECACE1A
MYDIESIRGSEYPSLVDGGEIYLDHAGTTLYPKSLIESYSQALLGNIYGNPHSRSSASERSSDVVEKARSKVLGLFNADPTEYEVIFTANATAAVKLIGEAIGGAKYTYLNDSHTSLLGLRNLAREYDVATRNSMEGKLKRLRNSTSREVVSWPCQSNFSGDRYPSEEWLKYVEQNENVLVLLDAASISSTCPPALSVMKPDFMVVSFYKIFGFPDLGALIVKKTPEVYKYFENRKYFGGGTVESLTAFKGFAPRAKALSTQLEDGTLPFHSILALSIAIDTFHTIYGSFSNISRHCAALAHELCIQLDALYYPNGQKLCYIYSSSKEYLDTGKKGPIVTFNLKDQDGNWIGYADFDKIALSKGINIRTGTLCNTGSAAQYIGIDEQEIITNYANGHVCGDDNDIMNDKPTGAIRASLGACSSRSDIMSLVSCLQEFYLDTADSPQSAFRPVSMSLPRISDIVVYPIKSCGGFHVPKGMIWQVGPEGLKWDREFCLVNLSNYSVLSLKKHYAMATIHPIIDEDQRIMRVTVAKQGFSREELVIPLDDDAEALAAIPSRICGDDVSVQIYTASPIVKFFTEIIGIECTLARFPKDSEASCLQTRYFKPHLSGPLEKKPKHSVPSEPIPISMANSSPLLLISENSVAQLANDYGVPDIDSDVFRANIKVSGDYLAGYAEDSWSALESSEVKFKLLGPCRRCNMVGVNAQTAKYDNKPYLALHKTRKVEGKLLFGMHMTVDPKILTEQQWYSVAIGDELHYTV